MIQDGIEDMIQDMIEEWFGIASVRSIGATSVRCTVYFLESVFITRGNVTRDRSQVEGVDFDAD